MKENVKGLLAYLFGWLGGIIILFGFKDNSDQTKFNCYQAIVLSGLGCIILLVLGFIPFIGILARIVYAGVIILQIIGMIRAYQETDFEIPVISDLTRDIFSKQLGL